MNIEILSLRITRRAIGAAVLQPRGLILSDGRHLPSKGDRAVTAAIQYVGRLLKTSLTTVVVDAPRRGVSTVSDLVLDRVTEVLRQQGFAPMTITKAEVLAAYAASPLHNRAEVRELVTSYWPELGRVRRTVRPQASDAAAAALFAECHVAFSRPPT